MADAKAAEHLAGEAAKALELLARLEKEPADAHGSLTPRLLKLSKVDGVAPRTDGTHRRARQQKCCVQHVAAPPAHSPLPLRCNLKPKLCAGRHLYVHQEGRAGPGLGLRLGLLPVQDLHPARWHRHLEPALLPVRRHCVHGRDNWWGCCVACWSRGLVHGLLGSWQHQSSANAGVLRIPWSAPRTPCRLASASPVNYCTAWCTPAGLQDAASLSCMLSERAAKYMQSHGVLESEGAEKHLTAWGHVSPSRKCIRECYETMAGCCCAAQAHVVSLTARPLLRRFTSVGGVHLAGGLPARGLEPAIRVGAGPPSVCAPAASLRPLQAWATGKGLEELEGRDAVSVGWSSGLLVDLSWASES